MEGDEQDKMAEMALPTSFGAKRKSSHYVARQVVVTAKDTGQSEFARRLAQTQRKATQALRVKRVEEEDAPSSFGNGPSTSGNKGELSIVDASRQILDQAAPNGYIVIGPPKPKKRIHEEEVIVQAKEEGNEAVNDLIPLSHEILLQGHTKPITALALDPSGSRLLSGSSDYTVRFWDFAGMDSSHRSFRNIEPSSGYPIISLQYSLTGDQFLVATGSARAKIFTRDGIEVAEFVRGDMYLTDMSNTKGHVSGLSHAEWHPQDRSTCMTSASDSTVRFWDVNDVTKQKVVIKLKDLRGMPRLPVTTCTYNSDASFVAAGGSDGSLWIWPTSGPYARPKYLIRDAHPNAEISCLTYSRDGSMLLSRALDDTLKVWDVRRMQKPIKVFEDLPSLASTNCIFSPDETFIITGTSAGKDEACGSLLFFDKRSLEMIKRIGVAGSVNRVLWHEKLNQIIVGGGSADVHVYYSPHQSRNGAILSALRPRPRKDPSDFVQAVAIHTPHALPLFKDPPSAKRKKLKDRQDPIRSHKPDLPTSGPGYGGRIGSSLTHHIMQNIIKKTEREEDPREAILKYAQQAEEDPYWFKAYSATQPVPQFDYEALKQEEEEEKRKAEELAKRQK